MSRLHPCPSCNRHVRAGDAACPFCGTALAAAPPRVPGAPALLGRLGRAALFAAGATLLGAGACTDSKCAHATCGAGLAGTSGGGAGGSAGAAGGSAGAGAGSAGAAGGSAGAAGNDAGTDAVSPHDGPVAIYSAAFPPPEEAEPGTAVAQAKAGARRARS
jgi:hypothetical protein